VGLVEVWEMTVDTILALVEVKMVGGGD